VLEAIETQQLQRNAKDMGERLKTELVGMIGALVLGVRGQGLFLGVELRDPDTARFVLEGLKRRRVLASLDGPRDTVLVIKPPLVWGETEVDLFCGALRQVLAEFRA
jgi:4-aminobutyrate aminotransferase-like enzyme